VHDDHSYQQHGSVTAPKTGGERLDLLTFQDLDITSHTLALFSIPIAIARVEGVNVTGQAGGLVGCSSAYI